MPLNKSHLWALEMRGIGYYGAPPELLHVVLAPGWLADFWFSLMPIGGLLIGEGDAQQCFLAERLAHNLHTYRQIIGKTGGYGNGRDSSYVYG